MSKIRICDLCKNKIEWSDHYYVIRKHVSWRLLGKDEFCSLCWASIRTAIKKIKAEVKE